MARTPSLGAHVSSAGGIHKAVERAVDLGAESFQIFGAAPQMWRRKHHPDEDTESYRQQFKQAKLKASFIHAVYLINLASPDDELLRKSTDTLTAELDLASRIGANGVIFHVGSHMGSGFDHALPRIAKRHVRGARPPPLTTPCSCSRTTPARAALSAHPSPNSPPS